MADSSWTSPEITSRCIMEHVAATFDYKVSNYLELKGMGVGKLVTSPVFRVGGYDWEIMFYPDGSNKDHHPDEASCYLRYLGQAQEQVRSYSLDDFVFNPSPGSNTWGCIPFADRSELKSMSRVGDGCFTIRCVLTVRKESPPLELPVHLERMLGDGRGADVTFSVGGEEFCAHRSLLAARSPIFAAQLFGPMAEKDMRHVEVMDMEPTIFEMMLHYIYTDSMPPRSDDDGGGYNAPVMQHLLVAADRYAIDRLKHMCEEELCKRMDAETVTNTLALADQHQCERLKKACVAFMASAKVMTAVVETQGFKKHLKICSRPLSLEGIPNEKRQPWIRRKYFLRSRPPSLEGIQKEKRQPLIQRKYLLRSRPLSLKGSTQQKRQPSIQRKYLLRSRPLSVEGIPQGGKEKRQPSIQRKYLLRSRPFVPVH
ncbi:hypothetical protein QYE76_046371 [Lolium multiflorum]|uniref:Speckle-type POZ protein-like protein n=1 Tax=Lolium multiflorum TaxID=4521 RepID=A0AAD8TPU8_LOLMU|nr:hypothetical protein QYE76_046371 [Lolium multiflorum]